MAGSSRRDATRIALAEKRRKALELRRGGATYDQVAAACGYANRASARGAVQSAIGAITDEPAQEVLQLELARLDVLLLGVWQKAKNGDVQAIDRALRILERRSAYLGLDAPKKTATTFDGAVAYDDGAHQELAARIAQLAAAAGAHGSGNV